MRLTTLVRTAVALAAALLLGGTLLAASPAASVPAPSAGETVAAGLRDCRTPDCWIAGSVNSRTGFVYMSWNTSAKRAAVRAATRQCKQETPAQYDWACKRAGYNRWGCLAVAYRSNDGKLAEWGWAPADYDRRTSKREAKRRAITKAKREVRGPGRERVWGANCTAR